MFGFSKSFRSAQPSSTMGRLRLQSSQSPWCWLKDSGFNSRLNIAACCFPNHLSAWSSPITAMQQLRPQVRHHIDRYSVCMRDVSGMALSVQPANNQHASTRSSSHQASPNRKAQALFLLDDQHSRTEHGVTGGDENQHYLLANSKPATDGKILKLESTRRKDFAWGHETNFSTYGAL